MESLFLLIVDDYLNDLFKVTKNEALRRSLSCYYFCFHKKFKSLQIV